MRSLSSDLSRNSSLSCDKVSKRLSFVNCVNETDPDPSITFSAPTSNPGLDKVASVGLNLTTSICSFWDLMPLSRVTSPPITCPLNGLDGILGFLFLSLGTN